MKQVQDVTFGSIVCGAVGSGDFGDDYAVMMTSITALVSEYYSFVVQYKKNPASADAAFFMPLALRNVQEASCSALLARVDPLRVIFASKCAQFSDSYDKGSQQASALKWQGDFFAQAKGGAGSDDPEKEAQQSESLASAKLWNASTGREKLPRALFAATSFEVMWCPAQKAFTDWYAKAGFESLRFTNLAQVDPKNLFRHVVSEGGKLYSELSKGVHPEFLLGHRLEFDSPTLVTLSERVLKWTVELAILSHFNSIFARRLPAEELIDAIARIDGEFGK